MADGMPASSLYYGISFHPSANQQAGDRFVFINGPAGSCSVDEWLTSEGFHTVLASGTLAVTSGVIELSVPIADLAPPAYSWIACWNDQNGPSLDGTDDVIGVF